MDWNHLLFRFDGRINRAKYWIVAALSVAALVAAMLLLMLLLPSMVGWLLVGLLMLVLIYVGIAVGVKRLHDRNKSGWWLLLFYLVPGVLQGLAGESFTGVGLILNVIGFAISIWALVELGILRGTEGANDYGQDPLEQPA